MIGTDPPSRPPAGPNAERRTHVDRESADGFRSLGLLRGVQARARARALDLPHLDQDLPGDGLFLDLGCGQGIAARWLASRRAAARVVGVDLDGEKIEQGRRLGSGLPNLDFVSRRLEEFLPELSDGSVQGALLADVLSSIPFELQDQLIHGVARVLAPGGRVVLLFVDTQPRLRAAVTAVRSFFVCRFLRLSRSATWRFFYRSRAALRRCLESEGLEIIKDHGLPGFAPRRKFVAEKRRS